MTSFAAADIKAQADEAYGKEDFPKALKLYTKLAKQGESAKVYYNLGCTYYRMDDMAHAVLWFERAAQLDPSDKDIIFNLDMARSKTIDRITPRHEMFFVSAYKSLAKTFSVTGWAYIAVTCFLLFLLLLALYIYSGNIALRKTGFFGACIFLLVCIFSNVFAWSQRSINESHSSAIILSPAVTVKSTPSASGTDLFVIHEGTHIEILDSSMKEWAEVQIADGKVGWVEKKTYEVI